MHNYWLVEILLALAATLVATQYWHISRYRLQTPALLVTGGLLCLALAAAVGAYRYGIDPGITGLHRALSRLSGAVSFLSIGLGLLWARLQLPLGYRGRAPAYAIFALAVGSALGLAETTGFDAQSVNRLYSAVGLSLWLLVAAMELFGRHSLSRLQVLLLAAGALLVIIAGLFVGTGARRVLGLARINWFHLMLALGVMSLLCALPIFRREKNE
ncbi:MULTISPECIES: hypothetical protein [unclassified Microbulbifer]|uniref:hypothetical protein n=1 Tax=unclassified Microbulbifer TaxID=2619833 RepID=UPI0027E5BAE5|nr:MULTISPECIES: hypothetical protein [unclassified Microbulbifer]